MKSKFLIILCLLSGSPVSYSEGGVVQEDILSISLKELLDLKVSASSNVITEQRKLPVSTSIIDTQMISMSGARTLNELLTIYVPGYFLVEDQDDTIAGFRGVVPDNNSKLLLMVNGIALNADWFWGAPDAILNGIDFSYIEKIEVIRGPGSVTLGQGALIGVINIITRSFDNDGNSIGLSVGENGLNKYFADTKFNLGQSPVYLLLSVGRFDSDSMTNSGWSAVREDQGLSVYERNHHLKRAEYFNFLANYETENFRFDWSHFEQERDLYNFYRDREVVKQELDTLAIGYNRSLTKSLGLTIATHFTQDDYQLKSHGGNTNLDARFEYETNGSGFSGVANSTVGAVDGVVTPGQVMGGTRENRFGIKLTFNWQDAWPNHNLAFGFESQAFDSGKKNSQGNNFIVNEEIQLLGLESDGQGGIIVNGTVNENNTWVKPAKSVVNSVFFEDFWKVSKNIDLFAAFRYDDHPEWGDQLSPRIGGIYDIDKTHLIRMTWQTGFRGAVGVQFSGGFLQDGLLAQENFDELNLIAENLADFDFDGVATNDSKVLLPLRPETIENFEIAYQYTQSRTKSSVVLFFNQVEDILAAEANGYQGLAFGDFVGSDPIGTWNGNWYYQNQSGSLEQVGMEVEYQHAFEQFEFGLSHAHVQVASADPDTIGIYVLEGEKNAAYPKDVSRMHIRAPIKLFGHDMHAHYNHLFYWRYFAPTGVKVDGEHIANLAISWSQSQTNSGWSVVAQIKNIWQADGLYPINGTGSFAEADGTPSIEPRSIGLSVKYQF